MKGASHLTALDGMRGFAALTVVLYHLAHWLGFPWLATNGNLAVDLFFCLSGYVLALSYGAEAAPGLRFARFATLRLIRLMPLIVLATVVSAIFVLFRLLVKQETGFGSLALAFILGLTSLPYLDAPPAIGGPQVFPLNGPQYTLFFELAVNALWFATRDAGRFRLAFGIAVVCFALLAVFGWGGDTPATFAMGFPRVGASFYLGVALYYASRDGRSAWLVAATRVLFVPLFLVMAVLFYSPSVAGNLQVLAWAAVIAPLLVCSGAQVHVPKPLERGLTIAGALSYPIYVLHYPVFCWFNGVLKQADGAHASLEIPAVVILVVCCSALALHVVDRPARARLSKIVADRWPVHRSARRHPAESRKSASNTTIDALGFSPYVEKAVDR